MAMPKKKSLLGKFSGVKVFAPFMSEVSEESSMDLSLLPEKVKKEIRKVKKEINQKKEGPQKDLMSFIGERISLKKEFFLEDKEVVRELLKKWRKRVQRKKEFEESIVSHRSIPNEEYLRAFLQILTLKQLKGICKHYGIRGYSRYAKQDLIEFIVDNLSEEEQMEYLYENERAVLEGEVRKAEVIIQSSLGLEVDGSLNIKDRIVEIQEVNKDINELEVVFSGVYGKNEVKTICSLTINSESIKDPIHICDCRIGSEGGFCSHFWVSFVIACNLGHFGLESWKLTCIPSLLERLVRAVRF